MNHPNTPGQSGTIQQFYEALRKTETYSAQKLASFQENVLKDLIPFVAKNVPFYRSRLSAVLHRDGSFNPEQWKVLPLVTAQEVRAHGEAFRPTAVPASHGTVARYISSGSTGVSTAFYRSALSEVAQNAAHYRHYHAFKLDPQRTMAMIRAFDNTLGRSRPESSTRAKASWAADWFAGGTPGTIEQLTVFTPIAQQVEWLGGLGETYLNTFPSNALAIARYVSKNPHLKPRLLAILTAGEPLSEEVRRQCAQHLGCACIDLYSNAECGLIACDCPVGKVLHIQSELSLVEILDARNNPARQGEWGRLVITPLYNFAMPLIRYDTGDLVRVAPPCVCGRGHQAIERGVGRPSNMLHHPKKAWFRLDLDTRLMEDFLGNSRWQLVQTGAATIELHYMPANRATAIDLPAIRGLIKRALGADVKLTIKPVAALGPTSAGKFLTTANHFHH